MAHRVQINQDQTVIDDIPYSDGDIAELDDDAFNAIPPGMFTSGKLTNLGETGGGGGAFDPTAGYVQVNSSFGSVASTDPIPDVNAGGGGFAQGLSQITETDSANNGTDVPVVDGNNDALPTVDVLGGNVRVDQYGGLFQFHNTGLYLFHFEADFNTASATGVRVVTALVDTIGGLPVRWIDPAPPASAHCVVAGQLLVPVTEHDVLSDYGQQLLFGLRQNSGSGILCGVLFTIRKVL